AQGSSPFPVDRMRVAPAPAPFPSTTDTPPPVPPTAGATCALAPPSFFHFVDVIDRPCRRAHPRTDERALADAIPCAVTDRGASRRAHRGAGQRPASREREHRQANDRREEPLPHAPPPHCIDVFVT